MARELAREPPPNPDKPCSKFNNLMLRTALPLFAFSLLLGCSGSGKTGTITGTVKIGGKSLTGGTISFLPKNAKEVLPITAIINSDGTYTAQNVPYGELAVCVVPPPPPGTIADYTTAKEQIGALQAQGQPVPDSLLQATAGANNRSAKPDAPPPYTDPNTSGLSFTLDAPTATYDVNIQ